MLVNSSTFSISIRKQIPFRHLYSPSNLIASCEFLRIRVGGNMLNRSIKTLASSSHLPMGTLPPRTSHAQSYAQLQIQTSLDLVSAFIQVSKTLLIELFRNCRSQSISDLCQLPPRSRFSVVSRNQFVFTSFPTLSSFSWIILIPRCN